MMLQQRLATEGQPAMSRQQKRRSPAADRSGARELRFSILRRPNSREPSLAGRQRKERERHAVVACPLYELAHALGRQRPERRRKPTPYAPVQKDHAKRQEQRGK